MTRVTIYTKPGCCLCDEARAVVERVRGRHPLELEEVDISTDEALSRAYGERIPVVRVNGDLAFEYNVDEQRLVELLGSTVGGGV